MTEPVTAPKVRLRDWVLIDRWPRRISVCEEVINADGRTCYLYFGSQEDGVIATSAQAYDLAARSGRPVWVPEIGQTVFFDSNEYIVSQMCSRWDSMGPQDFKHSGHVMLIDPLQATQRMDQKVAHQQILRGQAKIVEQHMREHEEGSS